MRSDKFDFYALMKTTLHSTVLSLGLLAAVCLPSAVRAVDLGSILQTTTNVLSQANTNSPSSGDTQLKYLSSDLSARIQALSTALATNSAASNCLQSAVQSLSATNSTNALVAFQQVGALQLPDDQAKLARQVRDSAGAYLVQTNLGALDGSQRDVAEIVAALHKGLTVAAESPIKKVQKNSKLTSAQKDFLNVLSAQCAPGVDSVKDTFKALKGFPGLGH